MRKLVAAILLLSLLAPVLTPLAALGGGASGSGGECAVGTHACMEGDRCTMSHRQCSTHAAKKGTDKGGRGDGHGHHHHEAATEPPPCDMFYTGCKGDNAPAAFSSNALETPFLISTGRFWAVLPAARLFRATHPAYSGPFLPLLDRPPSASPSIHCRAF